MTCLLKQVPVLLCVVPKVSTLLDVPEQNLDKTRAQGCLLEGCSSGTQSSIQTVGHD